MRYSWLFTLLFPFLAAAQDVQFMNGTWDDVLLRAQKENKGILVDAYTEWCGPCKEMDRTLFKGNEKVSSYINQHFISYKVDCERDFGLTFSRKFKITGYPTLLFFNSDGQLMHRKMGYNPDPDMFLEEFVLAVNKDPKDVYQYDARNFQVAYPDFYISSFRDANDSTWKPVKNPDVAGFLATREDLTDEISWAVMSRFTLDSTYSAYFRKHFEVYEKKYKAEASNKMMSLLYSDAMMAGKSGNRAELDRVVQDVNRYFPEEAAEMVYYMEQDFHMNTGNWQAFANMLQQRLNDGEKVSILEINQVAWTIYESCEDQAVLKMAIGWFKPYLKDLSDYAYLDTYAALLFKAGQLDEAELWAIKAIEAGKANNENYSATEELLENIRKVNR